MTGLHRWSPAVHVAHPSPSRAARPKYLSMVESVEADGLKIAYERVGRGSSVVFVDGAAEDSRIWQPQLAGLADEFTVVAWDEPGAGRSCDLPEGFPLAGFADGLAALLETLELGPAHIAGRSWVAPWCSSSTAVILVSSRP